MIIIRFCFLNSFHQYAFAHDDIDPPILIKRCNNKKKLFDL